LQVAVSNYFEASLSAVVLVADDDAINRMLAKKLFSKWGIEADFAENGLIAYEKVLQKDYDLVLMDMHMPVLDGLEATKKIRLLADFKYHTLPIIALTGSIFGIDLESLHHDGITDYFLKPYTPEGLYNKIKPYFKEQNPVAR
jgi:CheY-like chemotaxis protein